MISRKIRNEEDGLERKMLSASQYLGIIKRKYDSDSLILTKEDSDIILPFHLLGLNELIGVTASFLEFNDKIGP